MKNIIIIISLLLKIAIPVHSQDLIGHKTPLMIVNDNNIKLIMDSIIAFEKNRFQERDTLLFNIEIKKYSNGVFMTFIFIEQLSDLPTLPVGYINYKNNLFFITNYECYKPFKKTKKYRIFQIIDYSDIMPAFLDTTEWSYLWNGKKLIYYSFVDFMASKYE